MTDPREPAGDDQWGNPQRPGQQPPQQGWGQPTPPQEGEQGQQGQGWGQPPQGQQNQPGWGQQPNQQSGPGQQNWRQEQPTQQASNPHWGQQSPQQPWGGQQPPQQWGGGQTPHQPGQQNWGQQPPGQPWGGQQTYGSGQAYQQFPASTAGTGKKSRTPLLIVGALVIVAVVAVAALLLSMNAKDTLSQSAAQQGVSKVLTESYGLSNVSDVSCPSGQKVEKDATFTCTVLVDGDPREVTVKFTDDKGTYEVGRPS